MKAAQEAVIERQALKIEDMKKRLAWLQKRVAEQKKVMCKLQTLCRQTTLAMESFSGKGIDDKVKTVANPRSRSYRFGKWKNEDE